MLKKIMKLSKSGENYTIQPFMGKYILLKHNIEIKAPKYYY